MNFIIKRTGIERKEFDRLSLLILHSFFSAIFISVYVSVSNAEFAGNFGSNFLPVGYLISGVVGYITVQGYSRLLKKSSHSAFVGGMIFLLAAVILFRVILVFTNAEGTKWLSFIIFVFSQPFIAITGLRQSGLLLQSYDIREGKKYAGIINSGGTAASIVGYLSIPLLIPFLKSRYDLFYIAIFGYAIALFFLFRINKRLEPGEQKTNRATTSVKTNTGLLTLLKQKYIFYIALCGGISMMAFYFVDYSFLINAKAQARSPEELSAIIGGFFAFIKAAELVLSVMSGRIFRSYGLKVGILALPVICVFTGLCAIGVYSFSDAGTFIAVIFALKFFERCISKALEEPAYKNLYQLLNTRDRLAIQAKIDGGTKQLFVVLGSSILLLYGHFMPPAYLKIGLLYISIPIFLLWLFSAQQLVRAFKDRLRDLLASGTERGRFSTAFDRLYHVYQQARQSGNYNSTALHMLGHKLGLPAVTLKAPAATARESVVPVPFPKYLGAAPGRSRLEVQLYRPLLVLPPQPPAPAETRHNEYFDEKEVLQLALSEKQPDEITLKVLGKKLKDAREDHEKKLLLTVLGKSDLPLATSILLEHLSYPDYYAQRQVYKTLEARDFKCSVKEEAVYRNALDAALSGLTYIFSALAAIPAEERFTDLTDALGEEENALKTRLLSILTWRYDKASISVIRETIFSGSADLKQANNILALELIDNLVESDIKSKILLVFENSPYAWRLSALNAWYHFPALPLRETLLNILQHDYTRMGIWAKACALKVLIDEKNKTYRQSISGFIYHPDLLLRTLAHEYSETLNGNTVYPLIPKTEETISRTKGHLKGTELYFCIKQLKANPFFKKAAFNNLISFALSVELKRYNGLQPLAAVNDPKNRPCLVLEGNVLFEFREQFPVELFAKQLVAPKLFDEGILFQLQLRQQNAVYVFSPLHFANLLLASDALMKEVLAD